MSAASASKAADTREAAAGRARGRPPSPRNFYRRALTAAEQLELGPAAEVEGLADEIAMLRVRLKSALQEHPGDLKLLASGVQMLVKAVAAQYRLSPRARRDLADHITAVLNSLGDQLLPPAAD
ncbi:MAG: hypothetical protein Q7T33_00930 [Dehalococcoidia bacterium]|nr:hypothetical protein [Dehalococcoidia bacterium]